MTSPAVTHLTWGRIDVEGFGTFKDVKLWPGGARGWDWNETGTRHRPGIQPADLEEIVDAGVDVVVLGRGMQGLLRVPDETVEWLEDRGVEVIVERTEKAVERYRELRTRRPTGAVFHTTC